MAKDNKGGGIRLTTKDKEQAKQERETRQAQLDAKRKEEIKKRLEALKKYVPEDKIFNIVSLGNDDYVACEAMLTAQYFADDNPFFIIAGDTIVLDPGFLLPRKKLNRDGEEVQEKGRGSICLVVYKDKLVFAIPKIATEEGKSVVQFFTNLNFSDRAEVEIAADEGILIGKVEFVIRAADKK